jgi:hypothetical protein
MKNHIQSMTKKESGSEILHYENNKVPAENKLPPAKITTLQAWAELMERQFNQRYYKNPEGKPKFFYG